MYLEVLCVSGLTDAGLVALTSQQREDIDRIRLAARRRHYRSRAGCHGRAPAADEDLAYCDDASRKVRCRLWLLRR